MEPFPFKIDYFCKTNALIAYQVVQYVAAVVNLIISIFFGFTVKSKASWVHYTLPSRHAKVIYKNQPIHEKNYSRLMISLVPKQASGNLLYRTQTALQSYGIFSNKINGVFNIRQT